MMRTRANDGLQSINAYYKMAMLMPVERLQNIVRGKDNAIPATIAMMALEAKMPQVAAAQGQQAAQQPPQPSVREQIGNQISTLPENVGVGALPAPNMEQMDAPGMADGGIVAFAGNDGSVVEQKTSSQMGRLFEPIRSAFTDFFSGPQFDSATQQQLQDIDKRLRALSARRKELTGTFGFAQQTPAQQAEAENLDKQINALWEQGQSVRNKSKQTVSQRDAKADSAPVVPAPLEQYVVDPNNPKYVDSSTVPAGWAVEGTKKGRRVVDKKGNVTFVPGELSRMPAPINEGDVYTGRDTYITPQTSPFDLKTDAGKNANAKLTRGAGTNVKTDEKTDAKAGIATLQPSGESRSSELKSIIKDIRDASGVNDILVKQTAIEQLIDKQNKDEVARYKERPQYKPYEKYEKSLLSEEEKVKDKKNQNFQMALINAGLAIAGGSSRYALQNIGQGAMVGTKQYTEGLKDLEAAAKERQKAFAMIEEARNAKAEKDFDRYDSLMNKQSERMIASKQLGIEALSKVLNITVPKAADVYNNMKNITSNEAIANLNADVQRDNIQMHREGNKLQYQASMSHAAASAGYKDAMLEQNMIQKNLMAQQRGEAAFKDYLSTPEGKIQSTKAVSDPAAAKYLRDLRNWYMNDAYTGAGLKYNPGGQPSAKDQQGFKVLGVK